MYQHGGDIYGNKVELDFSANINPLGMPKGVHQSIAQAIEHCIHYPDAQCRKLITEIAKKEQILPQYIICGNGAADLIFRFVLAAKPKKALLLAPTFSEYEDALRMVECENKFYTLQESKHFLLQEDFLEQVEDDMDVIFLCNPNNPTGKLIPLTILERLQQICKEKKIILFLDECFLDFVRNGDKFSPKKNLPNNPWIFILRAFTKMYGMAGVRLGYGFSSDTDLIEKMKKCSQSWPVSTLAQAAGVAALKEVEFLEKTIEYVDKQRSYLLHELKKLGILCWRGSANYIFLKYNYGDLYEQLLEKRILIRSCHNYRGLTKGYYRIAVKKEEENKKLIQALKELKKEV
ncbi:MAG: aminotransferase class I/II-fold pyridoxal phosphate-dependent enzyme [Epulopiscium sp.]|jgi:threonine-phosphate decarboxylase|nr:aminotransferase class I/II-fold pyridoxal phosphate-dependent enzyme [Candidatus Epulonipiscium sp.]